ncbi:MAG: MATE family efflux transporter [Alphaproteobacteria bacterium]|nr:MATE family efflux transporter [Alphaproteobacteria bacterium]
MPPEQSPAVAEPKPVTHGRVWAVAGPIIISNSTVPLIGIADTAVIGHLGEAAFIAAIALGAIIFSSLYWIFGFLRMGTTGLVAQALGARDNAEIRSAIHRAMLVGIIAGTVLAVCQVPLSAAIFLGFEAGPQVEALAAEYFSIRIWGAPAMLVNFAILGWFIGLQRADIALYLQLYLNLANVALDVLFVVGVGMNVDGVALGTVIAEWTTVIAGVGLVVWHARRSTGAAFAPGDRARLWSMDALGRMLSVNGDIFIRSAFLMAAFIWLTMQGAAQSDVVLAANGVLLHFLYLAAHALDGFAFASEALIGESKGARNRARFRQAAILSSLWAVASAVAFALVFWLLGAWFIGLLTSVADVRETATTYLVWAVISPLAAVASYQLDGIFVGATRTADMRNMMALSFAIYIAAWWAFQPWGNHGLWAAFTLFSVVRGITLGLRYPSLERSIA